MNNVKTSCCKGVVGLEKCLWVGVPKIRYGVILFLIAVVSCEVSALADTATAEGKQPNGEPVAQNVFSKWPVPQGNIISFIANSSDDRIMGLITNNPSLMEERDDMQCTALHYAARFGRLKAVKWLLDHKADVNTVAYNKFTPMHIVTNGEVATLLIKAGADLNMKDVWNRTPLESAAEEGYTNVCRAILASGFPIDLHSAIWLGEHDIAVQMIKVHPELAREDDPWAGTSPLRIAAEVGDKELVEVLLKAGAPVDGKIEIGAIGETTPLWSAVGKGHYDIVEILCKAGADCNLCRVPGCPEGSLLDFALEHSDKKMIALLVKFGAKSSGSE